MLTELTYYSSIKLIKQNILSNRNWLTIYRLLYTQMQDWYTVSFSPKEALWVWTLHLADNSDLEIKQYLRIVENFIHRM